MLVNQSRKTRPLGRLARQSVGERSNRRNPRSGEPGYRAILTVCLTLLFAGFGVGSVEAAEVSFRNDVMAVLSKAGCNLGTCHGNATGKGGFKLSLRGEDPERDRAMLTRDLFARRTNAVDPRQSLILLKATATIAHEGGRRFRTDSREYEILVGWLARNMQPDPASTPELRKLEVTPATIVLGEPADEVQLKVEATFSDGARRDVTSLAVFEPVSRSVSVTYQGMVERESMGETTVLVRYLSRQVPVRITFVPSRPDFAWREVPIHNDIDRHVWAKLRTLRMYPSELCTDEVFLRRAYFDTLGVPPQPGEAASFLADTAPDKRTRLIEQLLLRPEFADFWALKWSDLLRNEERTLDRKGVQAFHHWIRQNIADGKPMDQFVRELVSARGSTYASPAANFYRANRDPTSRSEAVAQVFLGIRLQCARCHNHPFDHWTQGDYYDWAGVFARVQYRIVENRRRDKNDEHEFDGEQIVSMARTGEVEDPRTGKPSRARFLGGAPLAADGDRLEQLAEWLTDPVKSPQFARMQANRIWYNLLGRGIVDPIDDFRATNPPVNEPLLEALAQEFVAGRFDLRHILRWIMNSRTYQLSSEPNETNAADETNFSHAFVRPLSAEQLLDSIAQASGVTMKFNGYPLGPRAGELPGVAVSRVRDEKLSEGDQFLKLFGKPPRLLTCECERSNETTLGQAFQLISGPTLNGLLTRPDNRLSQLLSSGKPPRAMIEELYLATLSRPPSSAELTATAAYIERAADRRSALEDIAWGLFNAKEFLLRR